MFECQVGQYGRLEEQECNIQGCLNVGVLKIGIERVTSEEITVFQNIGNDELVVELKSKNAAEALIEEGFDVKELHVCCHPP